MEDFLLFDLEDVRKIRKVSVNIDDFSNYAQEVQRNYLEKVLGVKLYNALLTEAELTTVPVRATNLLDGVVYQDGGRDVRFRGLRLYLSYLWLYVYSIDSSISVTPIGTRLFKDELSETAEKVIAAKQAQNHYLASADGLEGGIIDYLRISQSTYPEFSESFQLEPAKESNFTFKVIGKTYQPPTQFL